MRLSAIEIVVGGRTEAPETRRRLSYFVSFCDGRQSRCRCVHEMWIPERALCDPACIARVVSHVVRGLMSEFAGAEPCGRGRAAGRASIALAFAFDRVGLAERLSQSEVEVMEFTDRILKCVDCGEDFVFSAGEQAFFWEKQFLHEPKHCKKCKAKHTNARGRVETSVTCSECGAFTTVPFLPHLGRPVLCRLCFQRRRESPHTGDPS